MVEFYDNENDIIKEGKIIKVTQSQTRNTEYEFDILFGENESYQCTKFDDKFRIFEYCPTKYITVLNEIITYLTINKFDVNSMIKSGNQFFRVNNLLN